MYQEGEIHLPEAHLQNHIKIRKIRVMTGFDAFSHVLAQQLL
jgi:hypothetical protein